MIHAADLTFEELLLSVEGVVTRGGHMIGGRDRKAFLEDPSGRLSAWRAWQKECQQAEELYPKVQEYFQRTKHLSKPPEGEGELMKSDIDYVACKEMGKKVNPPRFTWSFSSVQNFFTCAFQFAAYRYYKTVKQEDTEATIWGTRVHETAEHYALKMLGREYDEAKINQEDLPLVLPYLNAILASGGEIWTERKLAITDKLAPCDFFAPDAWGRGVVDLCVKKGNRITIFDWKTGKVKDDQLQLKVFCAFLALYHPDVEIFDAKFIWVKHKEITGLKAPLTRQDIAGVWKEVLTKVMRVKASWDDAVFNPTPSGLCRGWCSVKHCVHWGGGR